MSEPGLVLESYAEGLAAAEKADGRDAPTPGEVLALLEALASEGFLVREGDIWRVS